MKKLFAIALILAGTCVFAQTNGPEVFKVYREPGHQVNSQCNVGIKLTVDWINALATLENFADGVCMPTPPDKRIYILSKNSKATGSEVYYYGARQTIQGAAKLTIVDGRKSALPVPHTALIMVIEGLPGQEPITLYSNP